jgi:oxaloacetate decarboxylase beta subunit
MAARVSQKLGQEYNPQNHLIMHAMGPIVASTIGSALVAGIFIALLGG